ncbi:MAG: DUF2179 domain-containing protein [Chloroflexi bacterium HGW-Chloroflexi-4]|jgi:uncharacterized protein YebE (UPF0316 family)|nr:MAG: DUF2179 domain-containing protein [Chloroflexi bacterium HGW-Chloroflexi-4]
MEYFSDPHAWLFALLIFVLRVGDMALDTIRVLFVVRGKKLLVWILGLFQSLIFVIAISSVLSELDNILNIIGYATGFATGNLIGMLIENRLAIGHVLVNIISSNRGTFIAERLRASGYAVTEIAGRGMNGTVFELHASVLRKDVSQVETIVLESDPQAFVTAEDVRPVRRGFWRA